MNSREPNPKLQRVHHRLRTDGAKCDEDPLRSGIHYRGYLPHVKREGAAYFVTFRVVDSLPQTVIRQLLTEKAEALRTMELQRTRGLDTNQIQATQREIEHDHFRKLEGWLDKGHGECVLRRPDIAERVARAICYFEGDRYRLHAWVVMPNHVHVVLWPAPNYTLSTILQSWKRFTSREANRLLNRTGSTFWQPESYDHWIRDEEEHARCCAYVLNNPIRAGLCGNPEDWRWSSAWKGGPT